MHHYNPGKFLRELFPNQTRTPLQIILWTLVFLVDIALVFFVTWLLKIGVFSDPESIRYISSKLMLCLYLLAASVLFLLESWLYNHTRY